jgi:hypothetical protein
MHDLDIERHLDWAERLLWVRIIGFVVAIFAFIMFVLLHLPAWVWWAAWPVLGLSLAARWLGEYHRSEAHHLLRRSYQEPWWLGLGEPLKDWRSR